MLLRLFRIVSVLLGLKEIRLYVIGRILGIILGLFDIPLFLNGVPENQIPGDSPRLTSVVGKVPGRKCTYRVCKLQYDLDF